MAWNDISSIPWLTQNPTEVSTSAGLRGAQIGALLSQGRARDAESRREAELQPLRMKALQNQAQLQALHVADQLFKMDLSKKAMEGVTKLSAVTDEIASMNAWDKPESEAKVWRVLKDYPALEQTDAFQSALKHFEISNKAVISLKDAETRATRAETDRIAAIDRALTANERNQILKDQIAFKDLQHAEDVTSREKIATEGNLSREAIAKDRDDARIEAAWAKASLTAKDKLSEMGYRAFSEELDNITRDPVKTTEQKRLEIRKLHEQAEKGLYRPTSPTDFPAPTLKEPEFAGELEAKAAGKKAGDIVIITLNGRRTRVRLK